MTKILDLEIGDSYSNRDLEVFDTEPALISLCDEKGLLEIVPFSQSTLFQKYISSARDSTISELGPMAETSLAIAPRSIGVFVEANSGCNTNIVSMTRQFAEVFHSNSWKLG
jgi:hypothetical protein